MEQQRPLPLIPPEIGSMRLRLHDDILHVHSDGHLDLAKSKQITSVYQSVLDHFGYLLLRLDLTHSTGIDLDARRHAVEWGKGCIDVHATAATGAPLAIRMFVGLMFRATQILAGNSTSAMHFASGEDDAVKWLSLQRPRLITASVKRRPSR
ncbi:MAG TPA: hypothetical protein PKO07_00280 [Pseudomonadota bacterium]|nr:hypothetical protein [Pseudomonadota bacterium]